MKLCSRTIKPSIETWREQPQSQYWPWGQRKRGGNLEGGSCGRRCVERSSELLGTHVTSEEVERERGELRLQYSCLFLFLLGLPVVQTRPALRAQRPCWCGSYWSALWGRAHVERGTEQSWEGKWLILCTVLESKFGNFEDEWRE